MPICCNSGYYFCMSTVSLTKKDPGKYNQFYFINLIKGGESGEIFNDKYYLNKMICKTSDKPLKASKKEKTMGIKPGPKPIAKSTGKPDRRQRDNKKTPGNTPSLKPHKHKKGD